MGLMHNLFKTINRDRRRKKSFRQRSSSESFGIHEQLEERIALTVQVFSTTASGTAVEGGSPGYMSLIIDQSGENLYVRNTSRPLGETQIVPGLELADNPSFAQSSFQNFSDNEVSLGLNNYQDLYVGLGVRNRQETVAPINSANPSFNLQGAEVLTLPAGLSPDFTFDVSPGTLQGEVTAVNTNGTPETFNFRTRYLTDDQDGTSNGIMELVFFRTVNGSGIPSSATTELELPFGQDTNVDVTGTFNPDNGVINLQYRNPNPEVLGSTFRVNYASPVVASDPTNFVLSSGDSLDAGLFVDLPAANSTVTINAPITTPNRGLAVNNSVDLRTSDIVVNAAIESNENFTVGRSRFHSPPVQSSTGGDAIGLVADAILSRTITVSPADAALIQPGAFAEFSRSQDCYVLSVDDVTGVLNLSRQVTLYDEDSGFFYNPASNAQELVIVEPSDTPVIESSTVFVDVSGAFAENRNIQPGAFLMPQGEINDSTYIPLNTLVASVNTVTGRVDLTRPITLPYDPNNSTATTLEFYNPGFVQVVPENFEATVPIQAPEFSFDISNDITTDSQQRGRLYLAAGSGLSGVGGVSATRLVVNAAAADVIINSSVDVQEQVYDFRTTVADVPFSLTTKNSSGVSTGNLSADRIQISLANASAVESENSVVQVVDLDTDTTTLQVSAGTYSAVNPPFDRSEADSTDTTSEPFPFAISIREADDLILDANIASGGPVDIRVGDQLVPGNLDITASITSDSDVTFDVAGTIDGLAQVVTNNGQISIEGTDVNLRGLVQVLNRPFDTTVTDVTVSATSGSVVLGQGVRAVNTVVVDQRNPTGAAGSVTSNGVLAAHDVRVFAQGDVDIDTASRYVDVSVAGQVNGTDNEARNVVVDSATPGEFSLSSAGGTVEVTALGVDIDPDGVYGNADDIKALTVALRDTASLFASAPEGSIDVTAVTSNKLVLGVATDLLTGLATNMQAAGSVSVRTTQAEMDVLDAPIAGQGALQVRAAAVTEAADPSDPPVENNLVGVYAQNTPGITPATITGETNQSINSYNITNGVFGGLDTVDSAGRPTNRLRFRDLVLLTGQTDEKENGVYQVINLGSQSEPWQLRRYGLADTTAELPVGTRVFVQDGDGRDQTYRVSSYADTLDTTPLQVTQGFKRADDEVSVRFATESILNGTFTAGVGGAAATITAFNPPVGSVLEVNNTPVQIGDLILVRYGAKPLGAGNNTATSAVSNGVYQVTTAEDVWVLTRYDNPEPPTEPAGIVSEATVVVNDGFYRTSLTGETFTVNYDGLGLKALEILNDEQAKESAIGSYDPRDVTTLVVSTAGGRNDSAGSFGKMLTIAQQNEAADLVGQSLFQELKFGNELGSVTGATGTIVLQQELPKVRKPIVIDASARYTLSTVTQTLVIDGSRITSSSEGTFVTRADEVNGLELTEEASANVQDPFRPLESTVSSLRFGGFAQGSAVYVNGASNVLLDELIIGQNSNGDSQASRYGIRVAGSSGAAGPVTIVNGEITSSLTPTNSLLAGANTLPESVQTRVLDGAGVLIEGTARNVQIVGTEVGSTTAGNLIGVVSRSTHPFNAADPDTIEVNSIGAAPIETFQTNAQINSRQLGISETDTRGNPINIRDVYVGQQVSGSDVVNGTTIVAVDYATRTVTLSEALLRTNQASSIGLETPGRTEIGQNFWGVTLEAGATRIVNTDITDNVYDGVVIGNGLGGAVFAAIGASTTADLASNAIYSNGRNGIRFAKLVQSSTGPANITIQGNFIGAAVSSTAFVGNDQGSYFWEGNGVPIGTIGSTAFRSFGYDSTTGLPTPPNYILNDALFDGLITPEATSDGETDEFGNKNADFVAGSNDSGPSQPIGPPPPSNGNI